MQLFETTEEVMEVINLFIEGKESLAKPLVSMEERLTEMMEAGGDGSLEDFVYTGGIAIELLERRRLEDFPPFLLKKHQDYGAEPLMVSKARGMIDRMVHKIARIKNLQSKEESRHDHIQEEIQDLLGYSILGYLFVQKHGEQEE